MPFVRSIIFCNKPIIGLVHSKAIGIAFTILPLLDFVYCTKDTVFHAPLVVLG
jgi:enoyl-CoA hydratase/carnithine racemase